VAAAGGWICVEAILAKLLGWVVHVSAAGAEQTAGQMPLRSPQEITITCAASHFSTMRLCELATVVMWHNLRSCSIVAVVRFLML
jgi:hypothetical protein